MPLSSSKDEKERLQTTRGSLVHVNSRRVPSCKTCDLARNFSRIENSGKVCLPRLVSGVYHKNFKNTFYLSNTVLNTLYTYLHLFIQTYHDIKIYVNTI